METVTGKQIYESNAGPSFYGTGGGDRHRRKSPGGSQSPDTCPASVTRGSLAPRWLRGNVYRLWGSWEERGRAHTEDLLWPDLPGCVNCYKNFMGVAYTAFPVMVREVNPCGQNRTAAERAARIRTPVSLAAEPMLFYIFTFF